jgi:hypothetical protein
MDRHLTEDDLIVHFYGDGPREGEADVDAHLRQCAACQAAWTEIQDTLKLVDVAAVPEPASGFERVIWARVQQTLANDSGSHSRRRSPWKLFPESFRFVLPAAALVVAVIAGGYFWRSSRSVAPAGPAPTVQTAGVDARSRERVLLTALDDHFQQSELLLVEVMNAPERGAVELGFEREAADELIGSSRLYRLSAQQNGDVRLSQMLEDLETVLVEIARSPERVTRRDFDSLRARIDNDNLLFKVRAVSKQIHDRQRSLSTE